ANDSRPIDTFLVDLGKLYQEEQESPELRKLIRQVAYKCCDHYLPKDLPLDRKVGVWNATIEDYYPEERVKVYIRLTGWKKAKSLPVSGYDEFSLRKLKLGEDYKITIDQAPRYKELRETDHSKAVHEYNRFRKAGQKKWTPEYIEGLKVC